MKSQTSSNNFILSILIAALLLSFTGCASVQVGGSLAPGASSQITKDSSFYVVKLAEDERGVELKIANHLQERGYKATSGTVNGKPDNVDVVVTYQDRWMWDMTMYMIRLNITLENGETSELLGSGESYRTSLARKSPETMIQEIFDEILSDQ